MKFSFLLFSIVALLAVVTYVNFSFYSVVEADNIAYGTLESLVKSAAINDDQIFAVANMQKRVPIIEEVIPRDVVVKRLISLQPYLLDVVVYHAAGAREFKYTNLSGEKVFSVCERPCS